MDPIHFSQQKQCPQCSSHSIRQSRRRGLWERAVCAVLQVLPFRCDACDYRYFRRSDSSHPRMRRHRHA